MFLKERGKEYGLTQTFLDVILINSLPIDDKNDVIAKIHNYFFLYVAILHEQSFHYLRLIFNKLNSDINENTPKDIFLNLTNDVMKLILLKDAKDDEGDKGVIIIFGNNHLNLKQMLYFSTLSNYSKSLSQIEKEVKDLNEIVKIEEDDINNSFFKEILTDKEKFDLCNGNYDIEKSNYLTIKGKRRLKDKI